MIKLKLMKLRLFVYLFIKAFEALRLSTKLLTWVEVVRINPKAQKQYYKNKKHTDNFRCTVKTSVKPTKEQLTMYKSRSKLQSTLL